MQGFYVDDNANVVTERLDDYPDLANAVSNLPVALQHELFRFIAPQGPLTWLNVPLKLLEAYSQQDLPLSDGGNSDNVSSSRASRGSSSSSSSSSSDEYGSALSDTDDEMPPVENIPRRLPFYLFHQKLAHLCKYRGNLKGTTQTSEIPVEAARSYWNAIELRLKKDANDNTLNYDCPILRATLTLTDNRFCFKLAPPTIGASTRFYRLFGWERWIRVTVDQAIENKLQGDDRVVNLRLRMLELQRRVFVNGLSEIVIKLIDRTLVAISIERLYTKKALSVVFLFAESGPGLRTIWDFASSQIPPQLNPTMTVAKWMARFQLGLSKTVPTITFPLDQIHRIPDITSTSLCIGQKFLSHIAQQIGFTWLPSCIAASVNTPAGQVEVTWKLTHNCDNIQANFDLVVKKTLTATFRMADGRGKAHSALITLPLQSELGAIEVLEWPFEGPGEVMTDGCATLSRSAVDRIRALLKLEEVPSAFQARIGSSKGLWSVSPAKDSANNEPWIEVTDSQYKYNCPPGFSHVFEVIRWSQKSYSASLNYQTVRVLAHQGVPTSVFLDLVSKATLDRVAGLLAWDLDSWSILFAAVKNCSPSIAHPIDNISTSDGTFRPMQRSYAFGEKEDYDLGANRDPTKAKDTLESNIDQSPAGLPYYMAEQILEMMVAGSTPQNNPYLANRLRKVFIGELDKNRSLHIPVPKSAVLYVIADPIGCLKSGQVFAQFSAGFVDADTGERITSLKGPILLNRDPCVLPTDVQKVEAVFCSELAHLFDVVVFPRVGEFPLAKLLAGGDYDGDMIRLIWEPTLVANFRNARNELANPPFQVRDYFESDERTVGSIFSPDKMVDPPEQAQIYAETLLSSMRHPHSYKSLFNLHTRVSYIHSIEHPEALKLGGLYAIALDASKQGQMMILECMRSLMEKHGGAPPPWMKELSSTKKTKYPTWSSPEKVYEIDRAPDAEECPMYAIFSSLDDIEVKELSIFDGQLNAIKGHFEQDQDLVAPWRRFIMDARDSQTKKDAGGISDARNSKMKKDAADISNLVKKCIDNYREAARDFGKSQDGWSMSDSPRKKRKTEKEAVASRAFANAVIKIRSDFYGDVTAKTVRSPALQSNPGYIDKLKASLLYQECSDTWRGKHATGYILSMPWRLAFRELNAIKADRLEQRKTPTKRRSDLLGLEAPRIIREAWDTLGARIPKRAKIT